MRPAVRLAAFRPRVAAFFTRFTAVRAVRFTRAVAGLAFRRASVARFFARGGDGLRLLDDRGGAGRGSGCRSGHRLLSAGQRFAGLFQGMRMLFL